MNIINLMPFKECYNCNKCILSVKDKQKPTGEHTTEVKCKNIERCAVGGGNNGR